MSFASRLWPALPLLAAAIMTPAGHAATACPEPGSKLWSSRLGPAASSHAIALNKGCPLDCSGRQAQAPEVAEREAHAPLPLALVARAEDVADWHAGIFERLRGERFEEGATRYCAATPSTPIRPL